MSLSLMIIILTSFFQLTEQSVAKGNLKSKQIGAFASAGVGPGFNFPKMPSFPSVSTSSQAISTPNPGTDMQSASSSSSSSMINDNGKVSYKMNTAVKTNNDPVVSTSVFSDDINKAPKEIYKVGEKTVKEKGSAAHFANEEDRKFHKLSVFFIKSFLNQMGYEIKVVTRCLNKIPPHTAKNTFDILYSIAKNKRNYEDVSKLNGLCNEVNDISIKLNDSKIMDKVKGFLGRNLGR